MESLIGETKQEEGYRIYKEWNDKYVNSMGSTFYSGLGLMVLSVFGGMIAKARTHKKKEKELEALANQAA